MVHSNLWALPFDTADAILRDLGRELTAHLDVPRPQTFISAGQAAPSAPPYVLRDGVAVINVEGVIDRTARVSWFTGLPYTAGQDRIHASLDAALADTEAKAILISLNSPGGTAAGSKELADAIAAAARHKPCAAYADGLCASAAYWLASATGRIYAPQTALVGSIGVIAVLTDWSRAVEKAGMVRTIISSGKWKAAGNPDKALTEEERALFQGQLNQLHEIFKQDVAARMGVTASTDQWAEGQTLLAVDAQAVGLVTAIVQDQDAAIAALAANIKENHMDLNELKTKHPDLAAALVAEGKAQAEQESAALRAEAVKAARADALALLKTVAGEETAARVEQLLQAGITPAQLSALAPLLSAPKAESGPDPKTAESAARQQVINAITAATGAPLSAGADVQKPQKSLLVADAERRAAAQRMV